MKWCGVVGYAEPYERAPGVTDERIIEKPYYGDVMRNIRNLSSPDKVIDDITVNAQISIVSDSYALRHFFNIRYISYRGANWKVSAAEPQYPRILLTLGGVYNGETPDSTS